MIVHIEKKSQVAFPKLTESEIETLAAIATLCSFKDGETLFQAGERGFPFFVIESGEVRIVDESRKEPFEIAVHGRAEFTGDVSVLTDRPAVVSAYAKGNCQVYSVPATEVRSVIHEIPDLSDKLLEAFQVRRDLLVESGFVGVRVIGSVGCPELNDIQEFFDKNKVPHTWIDLDSSEGLDAITALGLEPKEAPVLTSSGGTIATKPSVSEIAKCLGLKRPIKTEPFDLIIVGAGPAGLAAAVYGASEGLDTLLVDRFGPGGQAGTSSRIENYMGFPAGLSGSELANRAYLQALKFGAEFVAPVEVQSMESEDDHHLLLLDDSQTIRGRTILIATGASYRRLPIKGLERWEGAGVYYSCTAVHARSCRQSQTAVIGGGNSAGQAAMFLAERTEAVYLLLRGSDLRKQMSDYLARRIERHDRITVIYQTEAEALEGERRLTRLVIRNNQTDAQQTLDCSALFVFVGAEPRTSWLPDSVAVDSKGFLLTGADVARSGKWPLTNREPCLVETTLPGVFAAGDVRSGTTKRVAFAVGDGALAVTCAHRVLSGL